MRHSVTVVFSLIISHACWSQGYICAIGGGSENYGSWSDSPYRWIVQKADSQRIIVLSAKTESEWIPGYFRWCGADTAFNYIIATPGVAADSATYRAIKQCRGVFIKGGDQWDYVRAWKNTLTEQAIREVFLAGGVVAGTSAGAAVLGDVVFDARYGSAISRTALRNPRSQDLSLTVDFLRLVPGCLFDTHFYERGRIGRLLAMMARNQIDTGQRILGIGLESETALCISPDGTAEVMGAGSVVFYYPSDQTQVVAAANQALVYTQVKFDALVAGYRYDVNAHEVKYVPPTATVPGPGTTDPAANAVMLFDDAFPASAGITAFMNSAGGLGATYVVVTSPPSAAVGQRYVDTLHSRGVASANLVQLDGTTANSLSYASAIGQADAMVFTSNFSEQFASLVDSATLVGQALQTRLASGVAVAYADQDSKLPGSRVVFRTELEELAAYRGKLTLGNGMQVLGNLVVMPLIFQSDIYDWNRVAALPWAVAKTEGNLGLYLDEGGFTTIDRNGMVQSQGPTPTIVIDAREVKYVGYSTFRHSGSVGPRQSTALVGARLHVLAGDFRYNSRSGEIVTSVVGIETSLPQSSLLIWNYPNPFNPSTTIGFRLTDVGHVSLKVFDLSGREVQTLVNEQLQPGIYTARFRGDQVSSGLYLAQLQAGGRSATQKILLLK